MLVIASGASEESIRLSDLLFTLFDFIQPMLFLLLLLLDKTHLKTF